jgi:hypothetical protein
MAVSLLCLANGVYIEKKVKRDQNDAKKGAGGINYRVYQYGGREKKYNLRNEGVGGGGMVFILICKRLC